MINIASGNIQGMRVGTDEAVRAYQGSTLVWTAEEPIYTALTCVYLVGDEASTRICGDYALSAFTSMVVDGIEREPSETYAFVAGGRHTIEWHTNDYWTSVHAVPNYAFLSVTALKEAHLPSTTQFIGQNAFDGCTSMTECNLSGTEVWAIQTEAFKDCHSLRTITIPANVSQIQPRSFKNCYNVTSLTFTVSTAVTLTKIWEEAFAELGDQAGDQLQIYIPSGVTEIGQGAFEEAGIDYLSLPNTLQTIRYDAFLNLRCPDIDIPASVTTLEAHSIGGFMGGNIWFNSQTPPFSQGEYPNANPFYPLQAYGDIKVPAGSLAAYQAACPMYADRMVEY